MMRLAAWLLTILTATAEASSSTKVTDLGELSWTLSSPSLNISVPGKVPSSVHLDLWAANVITDPYYGLNDYDLRWVIHSNWTYATTLKKPLSDSSAWLLFNGLDTFSSISLCGKHIASTNNQFRQYHFDVTEMLRDCSDVATLSVNFGDATSIAESISKVPGQNTWPPNVEGLFQFEHRQFVRKEQNDFGWDWGPAFVPVGIWQPAYFIQLGRSDIYVRNSLVDIYRQGQLPLLPPDQSQPWVLHTSIDYIGSLPSGVTLGYTLISSEGITIAQGSLSNITSMTSSISGSVIIPADLVNLWWPTGMGNQTLYTLKIDIKNKSSSIATIDKKVGFRTILLNQEPIRKDQLAKGVAPGSNWHFEINGKEFYAKGSNLIPPDTFWTRVTRARMQNLFDAVHKGNQNMLRVWSSGAYLPDFVYEIADELGILLWSEFQFGDALYPVDTEFLDNVREEANYQVRRVNHHPSLALWAGGNEMENLELNMVRGDPEFDRYLREYEMLFLDVLAPAVFNNSRSISYTPSSTSNGWLKLDFSKAQPITQRYYNTSSSEIYGNTDHYNYNSAVAFDWSTYPVGRFSNEFGFHSMPSIQTWRQAVDEKDLNLQSEVVRLRNRHYPPGGLDKNFEASDNGMDEMITAAKTYYPVPNKLSSASNFSSWCHVTQIFQADFYSSQIQFYRRGSGMPERQLGSLYWQLEDIWQAPTWAGIEYGGRWKVLHYTAKDRYKNVIISPFFDPGGGGDLQVYATSDLFDPVQAKASFTWYDWAGKPLPSIQASESKSAFEIGAINTTKIGRWKLDEALKNVDRHNAVLKLEVTAKGNLPNSKEEQTFTHQNWYHPVPLAKANLTDPGLTIKHYVKQKCFHVEASKAIAPWVWIDYPAGAIVIFEDNGFWLRPGEPRNITYEIQSDETNGKWIDGVTIESIWSMTQR